MKENSAIKFIPQIDGLRFLAVFGVMLYHWSADNFYGSFLLKNIPFGTGVNLFFVISGFLITYILLKKKEDILEKRSTILIELKNFYVKRSLRIFPVYYLLIVLLCVFNYAQIKDYLVYLLTYTINWYMLLKNVFIGPQTHLWSLAVEEQFYLIWPFLIFFIPRKFTLTLIISAIVLSLASKIYFYNGPFRMGVNGATTSCFDSLGFGALIAYFQMKRTKEFDPKPYRIGLLISIVLYTIGFAYPQLLCEQDRTWLFNLATSLIYFFLVTLAANNSFSGLFKSFLENKVALYLGKISYGLYLFHNYAAIIFYNFINLYFPNVKGGFDLFVLLLVMTIVTASISWFILEKPILSLKKYFQ